MRRPRVDRCTSTPRSRPRAERAVAGLGQQRADRPLGLLVGALAEVHVADLAVRVDQVLRRPVLVRERVPGPELVVLDHRVVDPVLVDRVGDVGGAPSRTRTRASARRRRSARRRGTRSSQAFRYGKRADAVDAGVGPEVDQHDPALAAGQLGDRERLAAGVEPLAGADEVGRRAEVGQLARRPPPAPLPPPARRAPPRTVGEVVGDRVRALELAARVDEERRQLVGDRALEARDRGRRSSPPRPATITAPGRRLDPGARTAAAGRPAGGRRASARRAPRRSRPRRRARPRACRR